MGTTADKLAYLEGTKAAIREAIAARGVDVPEGTAFRGYAGKIGEISGGAGGAGDAPPDAEAYYENCRPRDWLPLPEPQDDEIYFLLHVPEGTSSLLAFITECTGSYTVEYGTSEGGVFAADASASLASGAAYEAELDYAVCHSPTSDGMGQLVFRISGQGISSWSQTVHSRSIVHANWNIVDFVCRLPSCSDLKMGNFDETMTLMSLRFFGWYGSNTMQDMTDMFCRCCSLEAVRALDTSSVTNMYCAFYDCVSLKAIPALDTRKVTSMEDTFFNCYSIKDLPAMDTSGVTNFRFTFGYCSALRELTWLRTNSGTNFESCFSLCSSLRSLPPLSLAGKPGEYSFATAFDRCISLQRVIFTDSDSPWQGDTLDFSNSMLNHDALIELFNSLPSISLDKSVRLSNVPGTAELTPAEEQAMNAKGWDLQY